MPRARRKQFETFTDGILSICKTEDRVIVDTKTQEHSLRKPNNRRETIF